MSVEHTRHLIYARPHCATHLAAICAHASACFLEYLRERACDPYPVFTCNAGAWAGGHVLLWAGLLGLHTAYHHALARPRSSTSRSDCFALLRSRCPTKVSLRLLLAHRSLFGDNGGCAHLFLLTLLGCHSQTQHRTAVVDKFVPTAGHRLGG